MIAPMHIEAYRPCVGLGGFAVCEMWVFSELTDRIDYAPLLLVKKQRYPKMPQTIHGIIRANTPIYIATIL